MDILKKIFPISWKFTKDVGNFIVGIIIYILLGFVFGLVAGLVGLLVSGIPVVGAIIIWVLGAIGSVIGLYSLIGLVLLILVFCKVIKD